MNTTNGKIAEQSRQKLANALLNLMENDDYKDITVTQIAQGADLSRKTFYRLFTDKEMLLNYFLESKALELIYEIKAANSNDYWDIVRKLFEFWNNEKDLLMLLKNNNLLHLAIQTSYAHSSEVFYHIRSAQVYNEFAETLPYLLAYSIGGIYSMLQKWIMDGMKTNPQIFIDKLRQAFEQKQD